MLLCWGRWDDEQAYWNTDLGGSYSRLEAREEEFDTMSEWLRRLIRNQLGSARRGSNPLGVAIFFFFLDLVLDVYVDSI